MQQTTGKALAQVVGLHVGVSSTTLYAAGGAPSLIVLLICERVAELQFDRLGLLLVHGLAQRAPRSVAPIM
jgi:hypothetical protein